MTTKNKKIKASLRARTATLISQGAKTVGFKDTYDYIEENLYPDEAESVMEFCDWLDDNQYRASSEMPFVEKNYPNLYKNFFLKGL